MPIRVGYGLRGNETFDCDIELEVFWYVNLRL